MNPEIIKFELSDQKGNRFGIMNAHKDIFTQEIIPELTHRGANIEESTVIMAHVDSSRKCEPNQTPIKREERSYQYYRISLERIPFDILGKIYDDLYPDNKN